jgi:hypothetical protein
MILPPFFGYPLSYQDREIFRLYHSYLSNDLLTYTKPNEIAIVSYVSVEVLLYNLPCDLEISII